MRTLHALHGNPSTDVCRTPFRRAAAAAPHLVGHRGVAKEDHQTFDASPCDAENTADHGRRGASKQGHVFTGSLSKTNTSKAHILYIHMMRHETLTIDDNRPIQPKLGLDTVHLWSNVCFDPLVVRLEPLRHASLSDKVPIKLKGIPALHWHYNA